MKVSYVIVILLMLASFSITYLFVEDNINIFNASGLHGLSPINSLAVKNIGTGYSNKKDIYSDNISIKAFFCPQDECINKIIREINASQPDEITCFFYEANLDKFLNTLNKLSPKLYLDDNSFDKYKTSSLNIKYPYVRFINLNSGLMHMKYCVFNDTIITGSYNPTYRGEYYDNNNIVIIKSKELAGIYKNKSRDILQNKNIEAYDYSTDYMIDRHNNVSIKTCFSPNENCQRTIINGLKEANRSIYFMTFSFTDRTIANELNYKNKLGVRVEGIIEQKFYSIVPDSIRNFIINDSNSYNMHHKVFIIDNETVITGSYNPSYHAKYDNMENVIIIKDREIAERFAKEYLSIKNYKRIKNNKSCLKIQFVLPNPDGSDIGREVVSLKNDCNTAMNLNYFFIKTKSWTEKLNGSIEKGKIKNITPKYRLINSYDYVALLNYTNILSNLTWYNASNGETIQ